MRKQQKIAILGAGESGVGAALLAQQKGYDVFVSDHGKLQENYREDLEKHAIPYEEGGHTWESIFEADEVIKSPGIPDTVPLIKALEERGMSIIDEIEFASRYTNAHIIAITGSNGKTTTTKLTHHILCVAGRNAEVGGNIGRSFARSISEKQGTHTSQQQHYVLELSSFQLDRMYRFRPNIAILLNITPDHLDRYDYEMANYAHSKFRIAMNQRDTDLLIMNAELGINNEAIGISNEELDYFEAERIYVDMKFPSPNEVRVNDHIFDLTKSPLKGPHNQFNATCAIEVAQSLGIGNADIQGAINSFVNAPHRLEFVASINDIDYINDSKATNVDATQYALQAMTKPIIWVVGGTDKGNIYAPILDIVARKVKAIICLGVDNAKLLETFNPIVKNIEETRSAQEAVERANIYAESGDVVLLSPACASFDLFENYMDRGDLFKAAVLDVS